MEDIEKLFDEGRFEEALYLISLTKKTNGSHLIFAYEAIAYMQLDRLEDALTSAMISIRSFPCIENYNLLTNIYLKSGRYDEALRTSKICYRLFRQIDNLRIRTQIYMELKQYSNAIKNSKRILKTTPADHTVYLDISMCYTAMKNYAQAFKYICRALKYCQSPELYQWKSLIEKGMRQ